MSHDDLPPGFDDIDFSDGLELPDDLFDDPAALEDDRDIVQTLLSTFGVDELGDILINVEALDNPGIIRGDPYESIAEALIFLAEINVLGFSNVIIGEEGLYYVAIPDRTP